MMLLQYSGFPSNPDANFRLAHHAVSGRGGSTPQFLGTPRACGAIITEPQTRSVSFN